MDYKKGGPKPPKSLSNGDHRNRIYGQYSETEDDTDGIDGNRNGDEDGKDGKNCGDDKKPLYFSYWVKYLYISV